MSAGKRRHDADADGSDNPKRHRAVGPEGDAQGGGLRVALLLDVTRDGSDLGDLSLNLKPLQVSLQRFRAGLLTCADQKNLRR